MARFVQRRRSFLVEKEGLLTDAGADSGSSRRGLRTESGWGLVEGKVCVVDSGLASARQASVESG